MRTRPAVQAPHLPSAAGPARPRFPGKLGAALLLSALLGAVTVGSASGARTAEALILPLREVSMAFAVRGSLAEFRVKEGDSVVQGQEMVLMERREEELDVQRTALVLERARYDHEATSRLFQERVATEDEAIQKRIEMEVAQLDHLKARTLLDQKILRAPFDGVITRLHHEVGEWMDFGMLVLDMVAIDQVYAQILLPPEAAGSLRPGMAVEVRLQALSASERFPGTVDFVSPIVDASSNLVRVRVLLENREHRVRPGMRGTVFLP